MYSLWILWCFVSGGFVGFCCAEYNASTRIAVFVTMALALFNLLLYLTLIKHQLS